MAKDIIYKKQHYGVDGLGLDSDDVKSIVQSDLIANQLSDATNVAASVGLVNSVNQTLTNKCEVVQKALHLPQMGSNSQLGFVVDIGTKSTPKMITIKDTNSAHPLVVSNWWISSGTELTIRVWNLGTTTSPEKDVVMSMIF